MDGDRVARATQSGPVFTPLDGGARLHMRYTARGTNIVWKDDPVLRQALAALTRILEESHDVLRIALEPGMGIVCDNVLHKRTAFTGTRLLYRARYLDRIAA